MYLTMHKRRHDLQCCFQGLFKLAFFSILLRIENERERKKIANFFAHWGQKISEVIFYCLIQISLRNQLLAKVHF